MEDDVSARRVRRADPGGRLTGDGVDQDGRADLAVGRRGADADYRLGLSARRPEAYGLMAVVGVRDLVVVAHGNAILIVPLDRAPDVKRIVESMSEPG